MCGALQASAALSGLAKYGGKPAIFYATAANDQDAQWAGNQYPRCVYVIGWSNSTDRVKAGQLLVDIISNNMNDAPEDIAEALAAEMSELFVSAGEQTYCIVWKQSDQFSVGSGEEPKAYGVTITFQMMAFPKIEVPVPDVVKGIGNWIKAQFSQVKVIGQDELGAAWRATDASPACYVRLEGMAMPVRATYACAWLNGNYAIHIICPSQSERIKLLTQLANLMALEQSILLEDRSPFMMQRLALRAGADPLADGQMIVSGEYGVLRPTPTEPVLQNIIVRKE